MIRSAVLKLTFAYLAIIMALSIAFSITLYQISENQLDDSLQRPGQAVFRETSFYNFDNFRESRLSAGRAGLKSNLILLNSITFIIGLAGSYLLARKTLEPIERAMKAQSQFTADASHELRTPLTAIHTEIEVALRDGSLTKAEAVELLQSNLDEVEKLGRLSDGLLRLSRQDNGQALHTNADIIACVNEAIERVSKQASAKHIELKTTGKLGSAMVAGDTAGLTELIVILLDNAIKYSPPKTEVTINTKLADKNVLLRVSDQGVGIEQADMPYIFDRFYRADTARTKADAGGHGLGLSIAQKIVKAHGGTIMVEKTSKKGTTFIIKLHAR